MTDHHRPVSPVAPPPGLAPPPIDACVLLERCMGNTSLVEMLLEKFEKQARSDLEQIVESLGALDAEQISRTAHALKGAAGALGAADVQNAAGRIEHAARAHQLGASAEMVDELRREVERCLSYFLSVPGVIGVVGVNDRGSP